MSWFGINVEIGTRGEDEITIDEGGLWVVNTRKGDDTVVMDSNVDEDLQDQNLIALINTGKGDDTVILHEADGATGHKSAIVTTGAGDDVLSAINMDKVLAHMGKGNDRVTMLNVNDSHTHTGSGDDIYKYEKDLSLNSHNHDFAHMGSGDDIVDLHVTLANLGLEHGLFLNGGEGDESADARSLFGDYRSLEFSDAGLGITTRPGMDIVGDTLVLRMDPDAGIDFSEFQLLAVDWIARMDAGKTVSLAEIGLDVKIKNFENIIFVDLPAPPDPGAGTQVEQVTGLNLDVNTGIDADIVDYQIDIADVNVAADPNLPNLIDGGEGSEDSGADMQTMFENYLAEFYPNVDPNDFNQAFLLPLFGNTANPETHGDILLISFDDLAEYQAWRDLNLGSEGVYGALARMDQGETLNLTDIQINWGVDVNIANFEALGVVLAQSDDPPPDTLDVVQVDGSIPDDMTVVPITMLAESSVLDYQIDFSISGGQQRHVIDAGEGAETNMVQLRGEFLTEFYPSAATDPNKAFMVRLNDDTSTPQEDGDLFVISIDDPVIYSQTLAGIQAALPAAYAALSLMDQGGSVDLNDPNGPLFLGINAEISNFEGFMLVDSSGDALDSDTFHAPSTGIPYDVTQSSANSLVDYQIKLEATATGSFDGGEGNESSNWQFITDYVSSLEGNYFVTPIGFDTSGLGDPVGSGDTFIIRYNSQEDYDAHTGGIEIDRSGNFIDPLNIVPQLENLLDQMDSGQTVNLSDVDFGDDPFGEAVNLDVALSNYEHFVLIEPISSL